MRSVKVFSFALMELADVELLRGVERMAARALGDELGSSRKEAEGLARGRPVREYEITIEAKFVPE